MLRHASATLELTRRRSGVRVPTSLPFTRFFQSLANAACDEQRLCVGVCGRTPQSAVASVQESFHKKGHGKNKLAVGAAKRLESGCRVTPSLRIADGQKIHLT